MPHEVPKLSDVEAHPIALEIERKVRASLERYFREHQPANQGNNGIIFRIFEEDMENDEVKALKDAGFLKGDESAAKVLKIYNPGEGQREFRMQRNAYQALARARTAHPEKPYALIPQPLGIGDYELDEATIEALNGHGARLHGDKAETLFMEYLHAKDFARIVYEEVLARTNPRKLEPYGKRPDETTDEFARGNRTMEDLWFLVARMLNLKNPETKTEAGIIAVDQAILFDNSRKIFEFLAAAGYAVHPRLAEQLANTVEVMHALPMHHNDIHERNLMVVGDPRSADAQLYLIDFGAANDRKSALDSFRSDESLVRILQKMRETKRTIQERESSEATDNDVENIETKLRTVRAAVAHDRLIPLMNANADSLGAYMLEEPGVESIYERLAGLKLLLDEGAISPDEADAAVAAGLAYIERKDKEINYRRRKRQSYRLPEQRILLRCRSLFSTRWPQE